MELQESAATSSYWQGDEDTNGPDGQTGPPEAPSQNSVLLHQRPPRTNTVGQELQQEALKLEFQDSNLSPALSLLPLTSRPELSVTECSFFQQTDPEFAPLRAFPDVSTVSERFHFSVHDSTTHSSVRSSLSQHPLAQATLLSEEGANDKRSPSQHNTQEKLSRESCKETLSNTTDGYKSEIHEDKAFFLGKDIPAQHPLDLLQKEVGPQSSCSSAVSSVSQTSMKSPGLYPDEPRHTDACEGTLSERQGPPGEASPSQHQTRHKEIGNITIGSRGTQPDDSSEELHRELLSDVRRLSSLKANKKPKRLTPADQSIPPTLKESQNKPSGKPFSAGSEWVRRERDLWSSQNQTGSDGSYLGFLPQSQSTPGVFFPQLKFNAKAKLVHLSAIDSSKEVLHQSSSGTHSADCRLPHTANHGAEGPQQDADRVRSLPSLNYLQKVDAWRTRQSSERTPPLEGLALHRRSGVSPKKNSDETGTHSLILQSLQQPSTNQDATEIPSSAPSGGSSPRRGEAVGGVPSNVENKGSAAPPSASPFGRSQSLSSISTVVVSANKHKQDNSVPENKVKESQTDAHPDPITSAHPPPLDSLGHFSDVSVDQELSSSQGSYREIKVGPSVATSSVVSLELDNYAPYWTFKPSTASPPPPGFKELNIDERIPLYLQNLGIDQTPSKILTPFAPKGPIREPEFSPTDLRTIKGSSGTPSKSTQPSDGSSPHKGEFSRSSILSVGSTISIPFSLDSLGPTASVSEHVRARTSPSSDPGAVQRESRPVSQPHDRSHSSILHPAQHHNGKEDSIQPEDKPESNFVTVKDTGRGGNSALQKRHSTDNDGEDSFVSTRGLSEICQLLSQAENMISTGSSTASLGSSAPHLISDKDILRPPKTKASRLQSSSFSSCSSTAGDLKSPSFLPWARSSSDSMLTSHQSKQNSAGRESLKSSLQPDYPPAQAVSIGPQDSTVGNGAGTSPVMSKSARRTEPEGCSAAPPDKVPTQQFNLTSAGVPEQEEETTPSDPGAESRSSSLVSEEADQGAMSDGSSESSLAIRVIKLLHNESPATMASSTPSVTDQEEGKAREWIKSTVLGQQCEPLQLDAEDRRRIEDIKKELLLRNAMKNQGSTDTESSAASSLGVNKENNPPEAADASSTLSDANQQLGLGMNQPDPHTQLQSTLQVHLEARVCEIAAREGVALPTKIPQHLTSISVPTHRHSVTSSPSTSAAPALSPASDQLQLTELSTGTATSSDKRLPTNLDDEERVPLVRTTSEPPSVFEERASFSTGNQSAQGSQKRQDAVGGQSEEPPPATHAPDKQDIGICVQASSFSVGHEANEALRTVHFPHVHFSLPPKTARNTSSSVVHHAGSDADSTSAASCPDEGVGLSSPAEWYNSRGPEPDRADGSSAFKTVSPRQEAITPSSSSESFTQRHRSIASPRLFTAETPAPVLLPYKPHGSDELFYMPKTEADVSSTNQSDTTMESSHTGSDDAVPPSFSSEVLGDQDPGLDRGVAFRHKEGIYSRRLKTASFRMEEAEHTANVSPAVDRGSPALSQSPKLSSQVLGSFSGVPPMNKVSKRDQGTSPIHFSYSRQTELARESFRPAHIEAVRLPASQQRGNTLDHLWQKFCDQLSKEESRPPSDKEDSLLERLERLSRVIHHTAAAHGSEVQEGRGYYLPEKPGRTQRRKEKKEVKRSDWDAVTDTGRKVGGGREAEHPTLLRLHSATETDNHGSTQNRPFSRADGDQSKSRSTLSDSTSSVDTARLIRAFGAERVKHLKSRSGLSKLYGAINRQREVREEWRGTEDDPSVTLTPSETTGSDTSVTPGSASASSTSTISPQRGPSRALTAKRAGRGVNKSVQAGELEIVHNGTRRHTRDVGTTFPSPSSSSSSKVGGRGGLASYSQKQRKNKRSPSKRYPKGVSWFISADDLRSETRKENRPEESSAWRPNSAWFEPYSRSRPWREPLTLRQGHENGSNQSHFQTQPELDANPKTKIISSGLARVSLQEALEMQRPEFISRSKQRMRCLALQAEERRLQAAFSRERNLLFGQPREPERPPKPAGAAMLMRAVPRKEMIQRSKQIYENLPEVRRRREEERRKAEYQSYRLNARLYNKRIRNRLLGRRIAWN